MKPLLFKGGFVRLAHMAQLHLFNPGYEMSVLLEKEQYTPPANVRKMQQDLALLPLWYAGDDDFVYADSVDFSFLSSLPGDIRPLVIPVSAVDDDWGRLKGVKAAPWGLSPQSLHFFRELNRKYGPELDVPEWKSIYKDLTSRQTAAYCLSKIKKELPEVHLPAAPVFLKYPDQVVGLLELAARSAVIKMPYSSSGRGLLWVKDGKPTNKDIEWIEGAIRKQGEVSVEEVYNKVMDFAVEYHISEDGVFYQGLSMFKTTENGAYTGNWLACQDKMEDLLSSFIGEAVFHDICVVVAQVLLNTFGGVYEGYIGVDMLIYEEDGGFFCHPCVEINMRNTMGMVSICLFEKLVSESATGLFTVVYETDAYEKHLAIQEANPLILDYGVITKGYLSLCPVTPDTRYRAYILIQ